MFASSKKILLVGCGQLGSRHLQAMAAVPEAEQVYVVDPSVASLDLGRARLQEVFGAKSTIQCHWLTDVAKLPVKAVDLCIVATQAQGRPELVERTAATVQCRNFILEKVAAQSVKGYQKLVDLCRAKKISAWVNCPTSTYRVHKYIKSLLSSGEKIIFSRTAGNHGLGCNGVHAADLFRFYTGTDEIKLVADRIDPKLHASKRASDIFDLSGSLYGQSPRGDDFMLCFGQDHSSPDIISIVTASGRFVIDHTRNWAQASLPQQNWEWQPLLMDEDILVSKLSQGFARDILNHGHCDLPTLEECFGPHKFILAGLQPHFDRLLGKSLGYCPIT